METENDMRRQRLELLDGCIEDKVQRIKLHIKELEALIERYKEVLSGNE